MFRHVNIIDFRALKNVSFFLGKQITVIAGQNGTGKSTVLAVLAHTCERKEISLLGRPFRAPVGEILKLSPQHDAENNHCVEFELCDPEDFSTVTEPFHIRRYWLHADALPPQKPYPKVLPVRKPVRRVHGKDSKVDMPVLYLGLGRLHPIGEARLDSHAEPLQLTNDEKSFLLAKHVELLALDHIILKDHVTGIEGITTKGYSKKTLGIASDLTDEKGNSAGQDNITQILLSILAFKRLRASDLAAGKRWAGGLLVIDEADATLHADSQIRLFDFLKLQAAELQIQIVFTAHSLFLLEHIAEHETRRNEADCNNAVELIFLDHVDGPVKCRVNPSAEAIHDNLLVQLEEDHQEMIPVMTEDAEAIWFFKMIIPEWASIFRFLDIEIGESQMRKLLCSTFIIDCFLLVHDSDVKYTAQQIEVLHPERDKEFKLIMPVNDYVKDKAKNIVFLPEEASKEHASEPRRPERILIDYLNTQLTSPATLSDNFKRLATAKGFNNQILFKLKPQITIPADSVEYQKNDREVDKNWFRKLRDNRPDVLEIIGQAWVMDHPAECNAFREHVFRKACILHSKNRFTYARAKLDRIKADPQY